MDKRTKTGGMKKGFTYDKQLTKKWITNGLEETQIWFKDNVDIPEEWHFGRLKRNKHAWNYKLKMSEEFRDKCSQRSRGRVWYNDGLKEISILEGQPVPNNYHKGRLPMSVETKSKLSASRTGENNPNYNHKWTEEQKEKSRIRAKENPIKWTEEQRKRQSERLKGKNTWSKGKKRSNLAVQKWLETMSAKTEQDRRFWKEKEYATKKMNNSFNTSKIEDVFYARLCEKYGENNVLRQYRDDDRYPFNCDFYIPTEDLFIELNLHWTHGGQPFNSYDAKCLKKLNEWEEKAKTSQFYKNAIYTWTDLDVRKKKSAENSGLNYEVVYELRD